MWAKKKKKKKKHLITIEPISSNSKKKCNLIQCTLSLRLLRWKHLKHTANQISEQLRGGFKQRITALWGKWRGTSKCDQCGTSVVGEHSGEFTEAAAALGARRSSIMTQRGTAQVHGAFVSALCPRRLFIRIKTRQSTTWNRLHRQEFGIFLSSAAASLSLHVALTFERHLRTKACHFFDAWLQQWKLVFAKPSLPKNEKRKYRKGELLRMNQKRIRFFATNKN